MENIYTWIMWICFRFNIRNADDSDTEVVINQHNQGSRRRLTKRDELGQGDIYYIYIVKKGGSGTIYVEISWGL